MIHQASLSMGFSRQEYWSGLLFPTPRNLSNSGIKSASPESSALVGRFFTTEPLGKLKITEEVLKAYILIHLQIIMMNVLHISVRAVIPSHVI